MEDHPTFASHHPCMIGERPLAWTRTTSVPSAMLAGVPHQPPPKEGMHMAQHFMNPKKGPPPFKCETPCIKFKGEAATFQV